MVGIMNSGYIRQVNQLKKLTTWYEKEENVKNNLFAGHLTKCYIQIQFGRAIQFTQASNPWRPKVFGPAWIQSYLSLENHSELTMYSRAKKFVVFCSVVLHYKIQRTYHYDCTLYMYICALQATSWHKAIVIISNKIGP